MKKILILFFIIALPCVGQLSRPERKSLLDNDPNVVYLAEMSNYQIELSVIKEAPVFSDKEGKHRLGFLRSDQKVKVDALTDKAYKVRGKGTQDGIAGWVPPWAFSSKDPDFVIHLKSFYERQIQVNGLIASRDIALGMTIEEVGKSLGKPTKSSLRQTAEGQSGKWEFIEYEEQKNYAFVRDPYTGQTFRKLVSVTQIEKSKRVVEFINNVISAIEDKEDRGASAVRTIIPPIFCTW
jgi:hypothetical protein